MAWYFFIVKDDINNGQHLPGDKIVLDDVSPTVGLMQRMGVLGARGDPAPGPNAPTLPQSVEGEVLEAIPDGLWAVYYTAGGFQIAVATKTPDISGVVAGPLAPNETAMIYAFGLVSAPAHGLMGQIYANDEGRIADNPGSLSARQVGHVVDPNTLLLSIEEPILNA